MGLWSRITGRGSQASVQRGMRFDRFTPQMRRLIEQSEAEAIRLGHTSIGTLHFLAALARTPDSAAAAIFTAAGVAPDAVCAAADARLRAVVPAADALVGLDHAAKRAIELGVSAARGELGADFYGTQHLLLGMMRESADEATRALAELGVTREMVLRQARTVRVETSRHG